MATNDFPGLARLDALQRHPFGSGSTLRSDPANTAAGAQYRQQALGYDRALRILNRQARRGDARSALEAVRLRAEANEAGFSPGGLRRREEFNRGLLGNIDARARAAEDLERTRQANRTMVDETLNPAAGAPAPGPDATPPPDQEGNLGALEAAETELFDARLQRGLGAGQATADDLLGNDRVLEFRKNLDRALGAAESREQIDDLRERGARFGVPADAFDRRARWWERKRI